MSTAPEKKSDVPENEIRVSGRTNVLSGVERVEEAFKKFDYVILSGINDGISKVLLITEISKLKISDLHQYNLIETIITQAREEDKEQQEQESNEHRRYSTRFKVELHKKKLEKPPEKSFYEAPYTEEEIKKIKEVKPPEGKDRPNTGRGRGGRGRGGPRGEGRGRGGRGRGGPRGEGRGRGRGGPRGEGRGRGRGGPRGEGKGRGEGRGKGRGAPRGGKSTKEGETSS